MPMCQLSPSLKQIVGYIQCLLTVINLPFFPSEYDVSIPVMLSVAEDEGTVMVCAVLTTLSSTIFDIPMTLSSSNCTGINAQTCMASPHSD